MILTILEFALLTMGVKCLLGVVIIYYLFPVDGQCTACDGNTIPLQARRGLRRLARVCRIERRWCPGCGGTMLGRRRRELPAAPQPARTSAAEERTS
jgi:hypothetical protein